MIDRHCSLLWRCICVAAISCWSAVLVAAPLQEKNTEVYGFNIHYAEAGTGEPVVLLHGLWGGTNEWLPVAEKLSRSHRVIAMDFIGFHGSDKPEASYHNALLSQFLVGFLDSLGIENAILMGHAMGANAATFTAVHYPDKVRALVLVDGAGYRDPGRDLGKPPSAAMLGFFRTATGSSLDATRGLLERRVADTSLVSGQWVEDAFAMWLRSAVAIRDMLREGGDVSEEEMRGISVPTLVIWGSEDRVFSPDNAERLRADIENAEVHIISNAGHLPQLEQPDAFLDTVQPFLESIGTAQ